MLQRSIVRRSGHGDLFPTSKAAAHLTPAWVLNRTPLPPPGPKHRYVNTTRPVQSSKFQLQAPEFHQTVSMTIGHAPPPHCTTDIPSNNTVAGTLAGIDAYLKGYHKEKDFNSPIARANIEAKKESEYFAKHRTYTEHQRPLRVRPGWEHVTDAVEGGEYFTQRNQKLLKMIDMNPNGHTKEWFPWETKPEPKPETPKK